MTYKEIINHMNKLARQFEQKAKTAKYIHERDRYRGRVQSYDHVASLLLREQNNVAKGHIKLS